MVNPSVGIRVTLLFTRPRRAAYLRCRGHRRCCTNPLGMKTFSVCTFFDGYNEKSRLCGQKEIAYDLLSRLDGLD